MADTESLGEAGVPGSRAWPRRPAASGRVRIPTITDPRGTDFAKAGLARPDLGMLDLERRTIDAFVRLGVSMTDTCINYQTIQAPTRNEHVAFGDTGVVIYSNSVCGARSNFEGGPSALVGRPHRAHAALRLSPAKRSAAATLRIRVDWTPTTLNDWGALGGVIGQLAGNYWSVPVVEGSKARPDRTQLKHFGAAMASFGSIALFHLVGMTPEASRLVRRRRRPLARDASHRRGRRRRRCRTSYHTDRRSRRRRLLRAAAEPLRAAPHSPSCATAGASQCRCSR